jgi:hypothetical protein
VAEIAESIKGPVDFALIVFEGSDFHGDLAPALRDLQTAGTVRVIDAAFVVKDAKGDTLYVEVDDAEAGRGYADMQTPHLDLLNDEDLAALADGLELNTTGVVLVWENVWAGRFAEAVRASRGRLAAFERIPHDQVQTALTWKTGEDGGAD